MAERLQKLLAAQGIGSRRSIETMISQGRLRVNGQVAKLGCKVTPHCHIKLDGKTIELQAPQVESILYHKPVGEVCTRKPEPGQLSIYERLPKPKQGRWLSIGRLDLNTSGLLLLTTDGECLQRWQHPSFNLKRIYKVRAHGVFDENVFKRLSGKMILEDGPAQFKAVSHTSSSATNHWFQVTLTEGRHRLVRRMFNQVGLEVNRLIRIQFGDIQLNQLKPGQIKSITL